MANDLTKQPWLVDSASATNLTDMRVRISKLRWVSEGASAGDNCVLTDGAGRTIWESVASGANFTDESGEFNDAAMASPVGLRVPTLGSGTLAIYLA